MPDATYGLPTVSTSLLSVVISWIWLLLFTIWFLNLITALYCSPSLKIVWVSCLSSVTPNNRRTSDRPADSGKWTYKPAYHAHAVYVLWPQMSLHLAGDLVTGHFSGPGSAIGRICVCLPFRMCVWTITFEVWTFDFWPTHLTCWFIMTLSKSSSKVKVTCLSSRLLEETRSQLLLGWPTVA